MSLEDESNQVSDADFDAGFNSDLEATTTPQVEIDDEPVIEAVKELEAPKMAQITEAQYQELLAAASSVTESKAESKRLFDQAFGQLGGMKQRIEQMQSSTPAGQPVTVTEEDFAEMRADFPEFADQQLKVMNRILGKIKGTGSGAVDPSIIEKKVAEKTAEIRNELIDSHLDSVMENWRDEIKSTQFDEWVNSQPDNIKAFADSNKIGDAAKMLRLFSAHKNAPAPVAKPSTRQRQIEAAVTPKGVGGYTPTATEDDEFTSGFNSARN